MAVETPEAIPPPPSEPPAMSVPAVERSAPDYPPPPRPPRNRRRSWLWYVSALVALVVTLGAFGLLYVDDMNWQHQAAGLKQQNGSLTDQLNTARSDVASSNQEVKDLQSQLQHPQLGIWNVPQDIKGPNDWLEGGIPDTFTYHLRATSTGPMAVVIMTFDEYVDAVNCFAGSQNTAFACFTSAKSVNKFVDVTSVNYDFHLAEGCAGYMAVWTARGNVTVNPDVGVTYNPAPTFTGAC